MPVTMHSCTLTRPRQSTPCIFSRQETRYRNLIRSASDPNKPTCGGKASLIRSTTGSKGKAEKPLSPYPGNYRHAHQSVLPDRLYGKQKIIFRIREGYFHFIGEEFFLPDGCIRFAHQDVVAFCFAVLRGLPQQP